MEENTGQESSPALPQQDEMSLAALTAMVKAIQQQLLFLERKIDTLIHQSAGRPAVQGENRPRKPWSPGGFGGSRHGGKKFQGRGEGKEGGSSSPGRRFDHAPGAGGGFGHKKKRFFKREHEQRGPSHEGRPSHTGSGYQKPSRPPRPMA